MQNLRKYLAASCACVMLIGTRAAPSVYTVDGDGIVAATIEGAPSRLRIDPGAPSIPVITTEHSMAAGLKHGLFGAAFTVGPIKVRGYTAVADFVVDGMTFKRRLAWFDPPYAPGVVPRLDGVVGPATLSADIVRFPIHAPRTGERTVDLPMVDAGGLIGNWGGLFGEIFIGGEPMKVRFDLRHRETLANAGAGLRIANFHGGALTGPIEQSEIAFGIARPNRRMKLAKPIVIGPLSLDSIRVRVTDYGNAASIPDADAAPDPDEILVTAKKKRDRQRDRLTVGMDLLERCSSIVFDKPAKMIRLSCL